MKNHSYLFFVLGIIALISFSCKKELPVVTTYPVTNITGSSAQGGGRVESEGDAPVTERGVCWSIYPDPNINNPRSEFGQGEGSYNVSIGNLINNTTYYVRAYAISDVGTAYGEELEFTTVNTSGLPSITYNGTIYYLHPTDNGMAVWASNNNITGANSTTNGAANSATIDAINGSFAAKTCSQLNAYGYSDWYLPSKEELNALFINKNIISPTNFGYDSYWSSTEAGSTDAWRQSFVSGDQLTHSKGSALGCRCIRKN